MMILGHRARVVILATLFALLALLLLTRSTQAGWSADPVEVHSTTALCPLVSAAPDAEHGALIVWQEATASGGLLRARHLLASGEVDGNWPAPVLLSTMDVVRTALGSVSDGAGGAYVWWMEGTQLYLTRLAAEGAVATGWPARGRSMGTLVDASSRPVACADGSGGVYLAWQSVLPGVPVSWFVIRAHHLGPANTAKDGWPSGGRVLGGTQELSEFATTFGIAPAADGGLWLAYGSTSVLVEEQSFVAGEVRVARYTGAGLASPGWSASGVSLAPFHGDLLVNRFPWGFAPRWRLAAVADDGAGGCFVQYGSISSDEYNVFAVPRLQRVDATGAIAPGWPADGVSVPANVGQDVYDGGSASASLQLHSDLRGGVFAGRADFGLHGWEAFKFSRYGGTGAGTSESVVTGVNGLESAARGDGGVVAASYHPSGPLGLYQPNAYIAVDQSDPGASFSEYHTETGVQWYGDIGLAATGDGGSIFAWSQVNERFGVFAIRLNPGGQVTGVPPGLVTSGLRVWFVRGSGVQVTGAAVPVRLSLHDLTGREVARGESEMAGDWTVPGTAGLPSGIYFAKSVAVTDGREWRARVVVIR